MNTNENLVNAIKERDQARANFNASKIGSKERRKAGENLNFWQGKVAMLDVMKRNQVE